MRKTCACGNELNSEKEIKEVTVELSNPGTIKFQAPTVKCENCNKFIFSEEDAEEVFDRFDVARQHK